MLISKRWKVLLQKNPVCDQWKSDKKDGFIDLDNGRRKIADLKGFQKKVGQGQNP